MNYLCTRCTTAMCSDCIEISREYEVLLQNYKRANARLEAQNKHLTQEMSRLETERAMWRHTAQLGYPEVIVQWMDSLVAT